MPTKRERSTKKGSWSTETMEAALKAVTSGESIRKSVARFDIPFSTLKDRAKAGKCYGPSLGRKCIFSEESSFPQLLKRLVDAISANGPDNLKRGFRKCGIFPSDRQKVLERIVPST